MASDRRPINLERMCLRIENPLVSATIPNLPSFLLQHVNWPPPRIWGKTYRSLGKIRIFQHLSKEEAVLEVVESSATYRINVVQFRISTTYSTSAVDSKECFIRPISIHLITGRSVSVVHALEVLWTEHVDTVCDVEARLLVEGFLVSRRRWIVWIVGVGSVLNPLEDFGSDACDIRHVGVVTAVDESKTEVDVLLFIEGHASQNERSAVKTSNLKGLSIETQVMRREDLRCSDWKIRSCPSNSATNVISGRVEGWLARCAIVESAARIQRSLYVENLDES